MTRVHTVWHSKLQFAIEPDADEIMQDFDLGEKSFRYDLSFNDLKTENEQLGLNKER